MSVIANGRVDNDEKTFLSCSILTILLYEIGSIVYDERCDLSLVFHGVWENIGAKQNCFGSEQIAAHETTMLIIPHVENTAVVTEAIVSR